MKLKTYYNISLFIVGNIIILSLILDMDTSLIVAMVYMFSNCIFRK